MLGINKLVSDKGYRLYYNYQNSEIHQDQKQI